MNTSTSIRYSDDWYEQGFRDLSRFYAVLPDFPVKLPGAFMDLGLEFQPLATPVEFHDFFSPYTEDELSNAFPLAYLNAEYRTKVLKLLQHETIAQVETILGAFKSLISVLSEAAKDTPHVLYNAILIALVIPLRLLRKAIWDHIKSRRALESTAASTIDAIMSQGSGTD